MGDKYINDSGGGGCLLLLVFECVWRRRHRRVATTLLIGAHRTQTRESCAQQFCGVPVVDKLASLCYLSLYRNITELQPTELLQPLIRCCCGGGCRALTF